MNAMNPQRSHHAGSDCPSHPGPRIFPFGTRTRRDGVRPGGCAEGSNFGELRPGGLDSFQAWDSRAGRRFNSGDRVRSRNPQLSHPLTCSGHDRVRSGNEMPADGDAGRVRMRSNLRGRNKSPAFLWSEEVLSSLLGPVSALIPPPGLTNGAITTAQPGRVRVGRVGSPPTGAAR